jgi:hypothetical protein
MKAFDLHVRECLLAQNDIDRLQARFEALTPNLAVGFIELKASKGSH